MKHLLIISSLLFFLGCLKSTEKFFDPEKITGDWVTNYFEDDWGEKVIVFSFQDSTCSYIHPYGDYSDFILSSDSLIINERPRKGRNSMIEKKEMYYFKILSLDKDNLELTSTTEETRALFKYFKNIKLDTIRLTRIQETNKVEIERLCFYSTGCFGTCPSMYLEIDYNGKILFNGRSFTEMDGLYSGKISDYELEQVFQKVRNIQLDSLKEWYSTSWTDDQTCGVKIVTNSKEYESNAYGFDKEPIELRILFHKLMEVYKVAELEQDSTILDFFWDK